MNIVMVAAENDALPGGKVGGLGDVVRDLPLALADIGHQVTVVSPGYGKFADNDRSTFKQTINVPFADGIEPVELFAVVSPNYPHKCVNHWVLEHPLFSAAGKGVIYCNDDRGPFATDAHKFALFSAAVCELIKQQILTPVDILHCHDWHTANIFILREYSPRYACLKSLATVYSIHNLSIQGVRPFSGDESSLTSWFSDLNYNSAAICDSVHTDCVNFMRASIALADKVNTVSPNYAKEILEPSCWQVGRVEQ